MASVLTLFENEVKRSVPNSMVNWRKLAFQVCSLILNYLKVQRVEDLWVITDEMIMQCDQFAQPPQQLLEDSDKLYFIELWRKVVKNEKDK